MEGIKLNAISVLEAKKKLDAEYTESVAMNEWVNLGTGSLSFVELGKQVVDGAISGIKPKPITLKIGVTTKVDFFRLLIATLGGRLVRFWGLSRIHCLKASGMNFCYQDWRKNRRRALILLDEIKTPVKLKGKR